MGTHEQAVRWTYPQPLHSSYHHNWGQRVLSNFSQTVRDRQKYQQSTFEITLSGCEVMPWAVAPNEQPEIELNMSGHRAVWLPLWWDLVFWYFLLKKMKKCRSQHQKLPRPTCLHIQRRVANRPSREVVIEFLCTQWGKAIAFGIDSVMMMMMIVISHTELEHDKFLHGDTWTDLQQIIVKTHWYMLGGYITKRRIVLCDYCYYYYLYNYIIYIMNYTMVDYGLKWVLN